MRPRWRASVLAVAAVSAMAHATAGAQVRFDPDRAFAHLRRQVELGPRPSGSAALEECRRYILAALKSAGVQAREQAFDAATPAGVLRMANVIGTIPGRRPERIGLATHFDTKLFREFRFVGASDGASSTALVLELARVLAATTPEFTIELLFFDGEEALETWSDTDGRYGSKHYVQAATEARTLDGLKALVLLDMVGDRDLTIRQDGNSTQWLNDLVWASARRLGHTRTFLAGRTDVEDDHLPFIEAGIPAIDIIDFEYAAWHTADDTLDRVSARSLQIVGEVVLDAWPAIEKRVASPPPRIGF